MSPNFNLVDDPWVLVDTVDGPAELSLRDVFRKCDHLIRLGGDVPTQTFAILRVLLAIVLTTHSVPTSSALEDLREEGLDLDVIDEYLTKWRHRFELFDPEVPFMQVAGLRTRTGEVSGLEKLLADVPNGSPFFTMRAGRHLARLSPAEAARWLIHVHAFDPSGIRSADVNDDLGKGGRGYPIGPGWCGQLGGVVIHGSNLAETLVLNLAPTRRSENHGAPDSPIWERIPQSSKRLEAPLTPDGPMHLLTWQSRRVRLVPDASGDVCGVVLAQGDRLAPQNAHTFEPMSNWRFSEPQTKKFHQTTYMPRKHDADRSLWRTLPAVLAAPYEAGEVHMVLQSATLQSVRESDVVDHFTVQAIGITYGGNEATVEEIIDDQMALSTALVASRSQQLSLMLTDAVQHTEEAVRAVGNFAGNLARAAGERGDAAGEGRRTRAIQECWAILDEPARRWVEGLNGSVDPDVAHREWQETVSSLLGRVMNALYRQAPPASRWGRPVKQGGREVYLTADLALVWCRAGIAKALPLSHSPQEEKSHG